MQKLTAIFVFLVTSLIAPMTRGQTYCKLPTVWQAAPVATYYSPSYVVQAAPTSYSAFNLGYGHLETVPASACCSPNYISQAPPANCPTYCSDWTSVPQPTSTPSGSTYYAPATVSQYGPRYIEHERPQISTTVFVVNLTSRDLSKVIVQYTDEGGETMHTKGEKSVGANRTLYFPNLPGIPRNTNGNVAIGIFSDGALVKGKLAEGSANEIVIPDSQLVHYPCGEITLFGVILR
jgi:hypothetical protein